SICERSEANRVRGTLQALNFAAMPPHPLASLHSRRFASASFNKQERRPKAAYALPACGERYALCRVADPRVPFVAGTALHHGYLSPLAGRGNGEVVPGLPAFENHPSSSCARISSRSERAGDLAGGGWPTPGPPVMLEPAFLAAAALALAST